MPNCPLGLASLVNVSGARRSTHDSLGGRETDHVSQQDWQEQPLEAFLVEELREFSADGARRAGLEKLSSAMVVLEAISARVEAVRPLADEALLDEALGLGCLWAEQVCGSLGWSWATLTSGDAEHHCIVSPDRRFAIHATAYLRSLLSDREADNTVVLLFNMIAAGNVPQAEAGQYRFLS